MTDQSSVTDFAPRTRVVWLSIIGFWAFYFVLTTFRAWIYDADDQLVMLGKRALVTVAGVAFTTGLWWFLRRYEGGSTRRFLTMAFVASFPVALAYAAVNYTAFYLLSSKPKTTIVIEHELPDTLEAAERMRQEADILRDAAEDIREASRRIPEASEIPEPPAPPVVPDGDFDATPFPSPPSSLPTARVEAEANASERAGIWRQWARTHQKKELPGWLHILVAATEWYFFIATWAVLYVALGYAAKVGAAERQAARYRAAAQTAELKALRYQVNPHFLFNTLNSLSSLVLGKRSAEAEAMILNLSTFFRTSLTAEPTEDVRLADEIALQRLYLDIERARFPERLQVVIDLPDDLADARVPGMLLQPLVENAIKYGVARSTRPVRVAIGAWAEDGRLHLVVEDDGEAAGPTEGGNGIGLKNVCDRLAARFGDASRCLRGRRPGGGYRVELVMPLLGAT